MTTLLRKPRQQTLRHYQQYPFAVTTRFAYFILVILALYLLGSWLN